MGSSTNRNYTPVGRFFYILISMLNLFLNSETLVLNAKKKGAKSPPKMSAPQTCPAGLFLLILVTIGLLISIFSCISLVGLVDTMSSLGGRASLPAIKSSI